MTEAANILRDSVERLLAGHLTDEARPAEGEWPEDLWRDIEAAGLPLLLVLEARGGASAGAAEGFAVLRALGRHAAPVPLAETVLAAKLLAEAGLEIPAGPLTIAVHTGGAGFDLSRSKDGWQVSGTARGVPWPRQAVRIVATAASEDGDRLVAFAPPPDSIADGHNLAGEPRGHVTLEGLALPEGAVAPAGDAEAPLRLSAAVRVAQIAGALEAVLELTVRYAGERVQFGRQIGRFQAIQQQLAELAGEAAAAHTAARTAFALIDDPEAGFEVAAAKCQAGEAASRAAAIAHQVHGAIGFTREYALHRWTRRLWSWREEFGNEAHWAAMLGRAVAAAGADALWPRLSADPGRLAAGADDG